MKTVGLIIKEAPPRKRGGRKKAVKGSEKGDKSKQLAPSEL